MKTPFLLLILSLFLLSQSAGAGNLHFADSSDGPEDVVRELYDLVTFKAGTTPDWDAVRALFLPEAIIILRTSREGTTIFDLEGFVGDFVAFIERSKVEESGFSEKILKMQPIVFGTLAHFLVLYEASIPGRNFPPQKGVDSFQLTKTDKGWKIVSITNDIPTDQRPIPRLLQQEK